MASISRLICFVLLLAVPFGHASANGLKDFEFAKVLLDEGEWAAAMNFFGLALTDHRLSRQQKAVAYHLRGVSRGKLNKHRLALLDHKRAIKLVPDYVSAWSSICYQHGAQTKQLDDAMTACDRALELDPTHAPSYALRAEVWQGKGETERAEADFARAIQLNPKSWGVYFKRGLFFHANGRPGEAKADLAKAYKLAPDWEREQLASMDVIREYGIPN